MVAALKPLAANPAKRERNVPMGAAVEQRAHARPRAEHHQRRAHQHSRQRLVVQLG